MAAEWATGTAPPPGPALTVRGELGYLHDPASRRLVGVLAGWQLVRDGHTTSVEGSPSWTEGEPRPDTPLVLSLVTPQSILSGVGRTQNLLAWQWRSHEPLRQGVDLLDDWPVPAADRVPLGGGVVWLVRSVPKRRQLIRAVRQAARTGAPAFGELLDAYNGGFEGLPERRRRLTVEQTAALKEYLLNQATAGISAMKAAA